MAAIFGKKCLATSPIEQLDAEGPKHSVTARDTVTDCISHERPHPASPATGYTTGLESGMPTARPLPALAEPAPDRLSQSHSPTGATSLWPQVRDLLCARTRRPRDEGGHHQAPVATHSAPTACSHSDHATW